VSVAMNPAILHHIVFSLNRALPTGFLLYE